MSLSDHSSKYIKKYQKIYRKEISVAHQRENGRIIKRSVNKSKTLWQIIEKETANSHNEIENVSLQIDSKLVIDPQVVSQQFIEFFVNSVGKLIHSNKNCKIDHDTRNDVTQNLNVLFLAPATVEEVLQIAKKLKMKSSAGYNEIPDTMYTYCKKAFDFYNKFIIKFRYLS
jgi:hypothetical protein